MGEKDDPALQEKTTPQPDPVERPEDADDHKFDRFGDGADDTESRDPTEDARDDTEARRTSRLYKFARRLMDRRELAEDTREMMWAVLSTSDKAKTEMVKMIAREVRHYLDELKLKDDLVDVMRHHSLEVTASIKLKPLADQLAGEEEEEEES